MAAVTFPNGNTYSDDSNALTGLRRGGAKTRFIPLCQDVVSVAALAVTAVNGPNNILNSTTPVTIPVAFPADLTFTVETGKAVAVGQTFTGSSKANATTKQVTGKVKSYIGDQLVLTVTSGNTLGSGSVSDWQFGIGYGGGVVAATRQVASGGLVTGGGDLSADRTLTVTAATTAQVRAGTDAATAITPAGLAASAAFITLTDASTIAWDASTGYNAKCVQTAARIIGFPSNLQDGQTYTLNFDCNGYTPTFHSNWDWGLSGTPTLVTTAGKIHKFVAQYNSASGKLEASYRAPA